MLTRVPPTSAMSDPTLPIRTERLTLRRLTADDLAEHTRLVCDASVARYLLVEALDPAQVPAHLADRSTWTLTADDSRLCLAMDRDGRLVGEVFLFGRSLGQVEVGYLLLPDENGHGYATEAAAAMVDAAFTELDAHRVFARIDARNEPSAAVLRRLGMRQEAHLRENEWVKGEWADEAIFAITAVEWSARR